MLADTVLFETLYMGGAVQTAFNRGSVWHRWEPHIHTPGTLLADRYSGSNVWAAYINALETASPKFSAIGITDYCITRSYERVRAEKDKGRLPDCELLFPNIELRLDTGTRNGNFVNIHLLVCPDDPGHVTELNRFLGQLSFPAHEDNFACTPADLMRLGRRANPSLSDDEAALRHGASQFKVSRENLVRTWRNIGWARENILIAVAGNADGTSGVKEAADTTLREEIEKAAHAIFASSPRQRDFWLGLLPAASPQDLWDRYDGPKPCLWGCDAHELARIGKPDENRFCWIKGKPTFDALRQACIDPGRAYVGTEPPAGAAASQTIDKVSIENAPWAVTPYLVLNPGLVAIIGARGSGKTALADVIAAGCDSYIESNVRPSFLARAREYLSGARVSLEWLSGGEPSTTDLAVPFNWASEAYPRARYLSQQFVEELCSNEGMPSLIKEIERVIFEAHPTLDRDGAVDFEELLHLRAGVHRDARAREEEALANLSDQIGIELEKARLVPTLKAQIADKIKLITRYRTDREALLPKTKSKAGERLQLLMVAAEKVRGYLRYYANQQASLAGLKNEIQDLRQNRAPEALRSLKDQHQILEIDESEWGEFLIRYSGDVDKTVVKHVTAIERDAKSWKGSPPTKSVDDSGSFMAETDDPGKTPLAVLEAEIARLEKTVAADRETATKLNAVSKRIAEETANLERLKERLSDCEGASDRATRLAASREDGYVRVFDAILEEQRVLSELYAPLMKKLGIAGGTLSKLSFSVTRTADVAQWAKRGETDLFDLRGGPFKGIGSLEKVANAMLGQAWQVGDASNAANAMAEFRDKYQDALLENAPYLRSDQSNFRPWSRRFAQWLYSTNHITIEYGIKYDGIDIHKLSPGTRGIVLILVYLALDAGDDRPLIIDQPEENLDPKSIYDELVPLFMAAKRNRQVIMVTHNANLVVNTDADQIIVAEVGSHPGDGLPPISYRCGGLEEELIRKLVCNILEGGEAAFQDRARRLRLNLHR